MKKLPHLILLILLSALSVTACAEGEADKKATAPAADAKPADAAAAPAADAKPAGGDEPDCN